MKDDEIKYKFEFSLKEILKIIKGLQKLPYSDSNNILQYIKDTYYIQYKEVKLNNKNLNDGEENK